MGSRCKKHARMEVEDQSQLHRKRSQSASARLVEGKTCLRAQERRPAAWASSQNIGVNGIPYLSRVV